MPEESGSADAVKARDRYWMLGDAFISYPRGGIVSSSVKIIRRILMLAKALLASFQIKQIFLNSTSEGD